MKRHGSMGLSRYLAVAGVAVVLAGGLVSPSVGAVAQTEDFEAHVSRISDFLKERMKGSSWHRGCPVPFRDLRLIKLSYIGFDRKRHMGKLVAHKDASGAIVDSMRAMYEKRFKIRKMILIDRYDGNDRRSMRADNTSAFNCRYVSGTTTWSQHAYGRAIDINPVENPHVGSDGSVSPARGEKYADRSLHEMGMIHGGGITVEAFNEAGWGWGGHWSSAKDYQHFSATGT